MVIVINVIMVFAINVIMVIVINVIIFSKLSKARLAFLQSADQSAHSDNVFSWLMLSVYLSSKVITLNGVLTLTVTLKYF